MEGLLLSYESTMVVCAVWRQCSGGGQQPVRERLASDLTCSRDNAQATTVSVGLPQPIVGNNEKPVT
jgi:hypothetical protein